jgi:hypothetical protein
VTLIEGYERRWEQARTADWAEVLASFPLFAGVRKGRLRRLDVGQGVNGVASIAMEGGSTSATKLKVASR